MAPQEAISAYNSCELTLRLWEGCFLATPMGALARLFFYCLPQSCLRPVSVSHSGSERRRVHSGSERRRVSVSRVEASCSLMLWHQVVCHRLVAVRLGSGEVGMERDVEKALGNRKYHVVQLLVLAVRRTERQPVSVAVV